MATSGSTDWIATRDDIINRALLKVKAIKRGSTGDSDQITLASNALNAIVKELQNDGARLWKMEWVQQTLTAASEVTGTDSEIYTCIKDHTSASTNKPITGANWTTFWVKRGSTGGVWADATPYGSIGQFTVAADTIAVDKIFIRRDHNDEPVAIKGMGVFADVQDKTQEGLTSIAYINLLSSPEVYLIPQPDATTDVVHYFRTALLEDFDAAGNDPDFPVRWINALVYLLAADLAEDYQLPTASQDRLTIKAASYLKRAMKNDTEDPEDDFVEPTYDSPRRC